MTHDVYEIGHEGLTALVALFHAAAFLACLRYRRLSRYTYVMMAGFAGCVLVETANLLIPLTVRSAYNFDLTFYQTLLLVTALLEVVAWGLAVGGLAGTLAAADRRIRLLTLSHSPPRPAGPGPAADTTVLWDPSQEPGCGSGA
jgi:hypothetical protein